MPQRTARKKLVFDSMVEVPAPLGKVGDRAQCAHCVGEGHERSAVQNTTRGAQMRGPGHRGGGSIGGQLSNCDTQGVGERQLWDVSDPIRTIHSVGFHLDSERFAVGPDLWTLQR
jgi:hypothetical protein